MKSAFVLILLAAFMLIHGSARAQVASKAALQGRWIRVASERLDSSAIIDYTPPVEEVRYELKFRRSQVCNPNTPLAVSACIGYQFYPESGIIETDNDVRYKVASLQGDTLILEEYAPELPLNRLNRHRFVRGSVWLPMFQPEWRDDFAYLGDRGPKLTQEDVQDVVGITQDSGAIQYSVWIDFEQRSVKAQVDQATIPSQKTIDRMTNRLERSINDWDFDGRDQFTKVFLYLTVNVVKVNSLVEVYPRLGTLEDVIAINQRLNNQSRAKVSFQAGEIALEARKYGAAIYHFTEAYRLDSVMIDALYNRASLYYALGDKEHACQDWQHLASRGQMTGKRTYQTVCLVPEEE